MPLYQIKSISPHGAKVFKYAPTLEEAASLAGVAKTNNHTAIRVQELLTGEKVKLAAHRAEDKKV